MRVRINKNILLSSYLGTPGPEGNFKYMVDGATDTKNLTFFYLHKLIKLETIIKTGSPIRKALQYSICCHFGNNGDKNMFDIWNLCRFLPAIYWRRWFFHMFSHSEYIVIWIFLTAAILKRFEKIVPLTNTCPLKNLIYVLNPVILQENVPKLFIGTLYHFYR